LRKRRRLATERAKSILPSLLANLELTLGIAVSNVLVKVFGGREEPNVLLSLTVLGGLFEKLSGKFQRHFGIFHPF